MGVPISNVTRRVVYSASGTGPYNFTFEILANTDVAVYKDDALLTLTTDYTVTINANGTGYITLTASPTGATQIAIVGNRTIQRTTDFVTGGDFFANTVNDEMDQQTIFAQQNAEAIDRALKAPQTDPTTIDMTLPRASVRANKTLAFDTNGNPTTGEVIGDNRGNWAAGTAYNKRDIVKDTSNGNVYYANTAHTSTGSQPISTNTDSAKWDLIVDNASAGASASAAAASASAAATSASNASTSASNAASSASTASTQASNASTSATNAANSATAAASSASTASTAATNAGNSATAAATSATNASNSASSASTSATNASNSATSAATSASQASTSASNAASSASTATTQASNAATSATNAANSATASANSATAAAASAAAAAASFDAFDDIYLGAKSSDPTVDNDGNALTVGDQYFNTSANELRVWNGSTWQAASTVGGTVTSLNVTGATTLGQNPTLSAGTANGVAYLNGSKVLTTGSALTFDGTKLNAASSADGPVSLFGVSNATTGGGSTLNIAAASTQYAFPSVRGDTVLRSESNSLVFGTASEFKWGSTGAEWMRLTSTGLGIGTSSPAGRLDVVGTADQIRAGNGTVTSFLGGSGSNGYTGTLTNHSFLFYTNSAERMRLDSSGNLGLGVTPSAWQTSSSVRALQLNGGSLYSITTNYLDTVQNSFRNSAGTDIYVNNGYATKYRQNFGAHEWHTAPSGTAGNAITFTQAMTLDASTNLILGGDFYLGGTSTGTAKAAIQYNSLGTIAISADPNNAGANSLITFNIDATERMRLDSSGRLGINTTSPAALLDIRNTYGNGGGIVRLGTSGDGIVVGEALGSVDFFNSDSDANKVAAQVAGKSGGLYGGGGYLTFSSSEFGGSLTERARIDSSGNLLVGTTSSGGEIGRLTVKQGADADNGGLRIIAPNSTNAWAPRTGSDSHFYFGYNGTSKAKIDNSTGAYSALSDSRLKENITASIKGLDCVIALEPVTYSMVGDASETQQIGFIAQAVESIVPEVVSKPSSANEYYGLNYAGFVPVLVKAIQEQQAIIQSLTARVAALEAA